MKRRALFSLLIFAAVIWAVAAITLGVLLLGGYHLPFDLQLSKAETSPNDIDPIARIDVIDVGQGSSLLVNIDSGYTKSILIDAGEPSSSDEVCETLDNAGISALNLIVITHPHTDHFGGAVEILKRYPVSELWLPDISEELTPTNSTYIRFLEALEKNGCRVVLKSKAETVDLGAGAYISILDGFIDDPKDLNNASLCLRVDIDEFSLLVTGDGETELENALLKSDADVDTDILIAGHHGSNTSSSQRFLNAVTPIASAVSVGRDNDYGHPGGDAVARLSSFGNIYRTDLNGTITFFTDGEFISVSADGIADFLDAKG